MLHGHYFLSTIDTIRFEPPLTNLLMGCKLWLMDDVHMSVHHDWGSPACGEDCAPRSTCSFPHPPIRIIIRGAVVSAAIYWRWGRSPIRSPCFQSMNGWTNARKDEEGKKGGVPNGMLLNCRRGEPSYTAIYLSESPFIPFHQQTASIKSGFGKYTSPSSRSHPIPSHTFRGMFHIMLPASVPTPRRHSFTSCDFSNVKTS